MKKKSFFIFSCLIALLLLTPIHTYAACNTLLGNPSDENSVAWLLEQIFTFIKVLGPILVVVLSSIDFIKVIAKSDDEAMAKAGKKLAMRLVLAILMFMVPTLASILLNLFGLTSDVTCGLH